MSRLRRVLVVTPAFNSAVYLSQTLRSVFSQAAPGVQVCYHVQDGGSSDGTTSILQAAADQLRRSPVEGIHAFTFASAPDHGMYEAINRGFDALKPEDGDILTWINSDDLLAPGALATVVQVLADVPQCSFLSGRVALINAQGSVTTLAPPFAYARANLAAGLHDGRRMPFVMQEGTFFTGDLWAKVGGVDSSMRLAGDWDLWRRIAAEADHYTIDSLTGFHRRHSDQLTHELDRYYVEVDARLGADAGPPDIDQGRVTSNLVRYDSEQKQWVNVPFYTNEPLPSDRLGPRDSGKGQIVFYVSGFGPSEGPYPEFALPMGVRWLVAPQAILQTYVTKRGRHRCRIRLRSGAHGLGLSIKVNGERAFDAAIPDPVPMKDEIIEFTRWLHDGWNAIEIDARADGAPGRRLLIVETEILADPLLSIRRLRAAARAHLPKTTIRILADGHSAAALAETLESLTNVGSEARRIVVGADHTPLMRSVLQTFAAEIDAVTYASTNASGELSADWVESETTVTISAGHHICANLSEIISAGLGEEAKTTYGLIDYVDSTGTIVERRLPQSGEPSAFLTSGSALNAPASSRLIGRTLATRLSRPEPERSARPAHAPEIWLLSRSDNLSSGLAYLATAFALLGLGTRVVLLDEADDALWAAEPYFTNHAVFCDWQPSWSRTGAITFREAMDGTLTLTDSAGSIRLEPVTDRHMFSSQPRWSARAALGLQDSAFILLVHTESGMLAQTATLLEQQHGAPPVVSLVQLETILSSARDVTEDPTVLALWLSAVDAIVIEENDETAYLCRAADAAAVARIEVDNLANILAGVADFSQLSQEIHLYASKKMRGGGRSIEDIAFDILTHRSIYQEKTLRSWLEERHHLSPGPVSVRIGRGGCSTVDLALNGFYPSGVARLIPIDGIASVPDLAATWPLSVGVAGTGGRLLIEALIPLTGLRLLLSAESAGEWMFTLAGTSHATFDNRDESCGEILIVCSIDAGVHQLDIVPSPGSPALTILTWEALGEPGPASNILEGLRSTALIEPLGCRQSDTLYSDGDWEFGPGFYDQEVAQPQLGLHRDFCWSRGCGSTLRVRIGLSGHRHVRLAFTGVIPGQMVRLSVGAESTPWSPPIPGVIGRTAFSGGLLYLPEGDVDLVIELTSSLGLEAPRDLGILILGLEISLPVALG